MERDFVVSIGHTHRAATRFAIGAALGAALLAFQSPIEAEEEFAIEPLKGRPERFPVTTQFSPVPCGEGWKGEEGPLDKEILRDTVENIIAHGFSGLEWRTHRPAEGERFILDYVQSLYYLRNNCSQLALRVTSGGR